MISGIFLNQGILESLGCYCGRRVLRVSGLWGFSGIRFTGGDDKLLLTSPKPQGLKVPTFRIRLPHKSPKGEKLGFGPIRL